MYRRGVELTHQWVNINTLTGDIGDRTMNPLPQTPSVLVKDTITTYDFYQAGPDKAGMPNQCQCYVTVTLDWGVMDGDCSTYRLRNGREALLTSSASLCL